MVSAFPSTSDVAWTEMLGDRPLPGYQRTYFCAALNCEFFDDGISSTMEYEHQMSWQQDGSFRRAMGYVFPVTAFKIELGEMVDNFFRNPSQEPNYYAYLRSTDDAQHLSGDIYAMLVRIEERLKEINARYKASEGRDLEILILSDHGHNHAGPATRVEICSFLTKAGYRLGESIKNPKDVVLPTAGMESWVEIHNSPAETENLVNLLWHLEGVDILSAQAPDQPNRFIVVNAKGERATIDWNVAKNSFRYGCEFGDPLNYQAALEAMAVKNELDAAGFGSADAWMVATLEHRYPLALERIARAHTRVTLNPATILISLDNHYLHADWLVKKASSVVWFGGTHGALDNLNSDGVVMSNFAPTKDTSTSRIAALFDGFPGLRDFRANENGAEWVSGKAEALTAVLRRPVDPGRRMVSTDEVFLRVWSPLFTKAENDATIALTVRNARLFMPPPIRRGDPEPVDPSERHLTLTPPIAAGGPGSGERAYAFPADLSLEPQKEYRITGRLSVRDRTSRIFDFTFHTDQAGKPVAY